MWTCPSPSVTACSFGGGTRRSDETASTSQTCVGFTSNSRFAHRRSARATSTPTRSQKISAVGCARGEATHTVSSPLATRARLPRGGEVVANAASKGEPSSANVSRTIPPSVTKRRNTTRRAIQEPMLGGKDDAFARLGDRSSAATGGGQSCGSSSIVRGGLETDARVEVRRKRGNSTTSQAMANSVNILLGVGLLSVPYALKQGGWAGLGVLGLLGIVTNYTGKALIRVQERGALYDETTGIRNKPLTSYEDIGEEAFGKNGRLFIAWVLYTELVGTCALFFILEGDHLSVLFDGTKYLTHSSQWWQTCSALFMVPTLWLADLSSLSYFGALGATASVSLVGVVVYELYVSFDGVLPTLESLPPGFESTSWLHLSTLPVSFGLLAFVFAGHAVFPAIYASMEKPEDYEPMLDKTYAIVGVTCAVIGAAGYALYGDAVKDEVTLNLPTGLASTIALGLIAVNPLSKFALTMDPVARGLEGNLGIDIASEKMDAVTGESDNGPFKARVLRTGLGLGALLTAAKVPFFAVFMSLIGSFLTLTVSVIFPAACHLKVFDAELSAKEKAVDWAIMFVGGFCVVAGSTSAVVDLLAK